MMLAALFFAAVASAGKFRMESSLRVLMASTRQSRARSIPSLESLLTSFESLMTTLQLPDEYIVADKARMALVDASFDMEINFHSWFTCPDSKGKACAKEELKRQKLLKSNLESVITAVNAAIAAHGWSSHLAQAEPHGLKAVELANKLILELPNARGISKTHALTQIANSVDNEVHALRRLLTESADDWLYALGDGPLQSGQERSLTSWWKFSATLFQQWMDLSLAVNHLRSKGTSKFQARLVGDSQCVSFAPRFRTGVTVADILIKLGLYESAHLDASERKIVPNLWEHIRDELSASNEMYRVAAIAAHEGRPKTFIKKLHDHRRSLIECLEMFSALRSTILF